MDFNCILNGLNWHSLKCGCQWQCAKQKFKYNNYILLQSVFWGLIMFTVRFSIFSISLFSNKTIRSTITDVIFTDFAKAFDKVDHRTLLAKLNILGIKSTTLNWISSYLSFRFQNSPQNTLIASQLLQARYLNQQTYIKNSLCYENISKNCVWQINAFN